MSILLDHCVPQKCRGILQSWGYDVTLLKEHINPDADDVDVIAIAQKLDSVLLTVDMDFANILDYPPQNYQGIVVVRYQAIEEEVVITTLKQALLDLYRDDLRKALIVITGKHYRMRRG
jgi:predicted nuclease of predicted toxin-antitoxin system